MAWTPPLTTERAIEICAAICQRAFHAEGLWDQPMTSLEGVTLGQMLEAAALVERENTRQSAASKVVLHVVPDPRLIAGVFTLEHYSNQVCVASRPSETEGHRWMVVVLHRGPAPKESAK
jgi:hypothetical protein